MNLIVKLLEDFLNSCDNYNVSLTACNGEELIQKINKSDNSIPDILLLDLKMKGMNGIEVINYFRVHFSSVKIIVISSFYQDSSLGFMFKTGASAFLPKGITPSHLKEIITTVYHHGIYFTKKQIDCVRDQISNKTPKPVLNTTELSNREIEVLKLICSQKTAKEISEILFIAPKTVEGHKNNIFIKTGAKNIAGMVIFALQKKILNMDDFQINVVNER